MKTIKNTNSFYVLGVKFENIQEAIFLCRKGNGQKWHICWKRC